MCKFVGRELICRKEMEMFLRFHAIHAVLTCASIQPPPGSGVCEEHFVFFRNTEETRFLGEVVKPIAVCHHEQHMT